MTFYFTWLISLQLSFICSPKNPFLEAVMKRINERTVVERETTNFSTNWREGTSYRQNGGFATKTVSPDDIWFCCCFFVIPSPPKSQTDWEDDENKKQPKAHLTSFFLKKIRFPLELTWWIFFRFYYCLLQNCACAICERVTMMFMNNKNERNFEARALFP